MRISELLSNEAIVLNLTSKTKSEVITELIDKLYAADCLSDKDEFKNAILKREEEFSTGIGDGIAIPHAMSSSVKKSALAFGYSKEGIDYNSMDGNLTHIFFMIAGEENANNEHLETVSRLSVLLLNDEFRKKIIEVKSKEELINVINEQEKLALSEESKEQVSNSNEKLILAVTACPTGIAHTYMAADSLKNTAKEMGVNIKVETDGSTGVGNALTDEEIERATAIIVAADKKVEMERFEGKKVIIVPVVKGIRNAKELITKAVNEDAPVYHHNGEGKSSFKTGERTGFYKHLMNGVSNMLPFVVGGGILIAICFMFGIKSFDPKDPSFNAFSKLLMDIGGGNAFNLMIPVFAGFVGLSIADRPGFAPAMVGGLIAYSNGAGFLGGLVAGFLGGYTVVLLKKVFSGMPSSLEGLKPVLIYPLLGIFITGAIMFLFIVSPCKALNLSLQGWLGNMGTANKVFLGIILGGMMAVDMGGPINKAAYTFGLAMISAGNYYPHAAIMAGGMVPPLGIAIATLVFKNKFTKNERDAGKTCIPLGLSFITEGAIPFAASDPLRVIPSCVIGAALAGGLAMAFNIGLPAPHGGLFVIAIVKGNPWLYLFAILAGSVVTAIILAY